ncbi:MAG: TIGR01777 family protein [Bacteroidetes bacterium]|nr:TIGR01777 family protein [Bacteroidota bacterium]
MNILITGATGMLGKRLVPMLKEEGMDVSILTTSQIKQNVKQKVFLWDVKNGTFPENLTQPIDIVIHLAGANVGARRWTSRYKKEILESRAETSLFLLKKLKEQNNLPKSYITASGTDYYPNPSDVIFTESDLPGKQFLSEVCIAWEAVAETWHKAGCIAQIVRTPVVLAAGEGFMAKMMQTAHMGIIPTTGSPKNKLSWIHAEDLCRIYRFLLDKKESGIWNAVAPHVVDMKQLVCTIDKARGKRTLHPNVPCFMLKLMLGELGTLACGSQQVSAEKLLQAGFGYLYSTSEKAFNDIFKPKT